MQPYTLKTTLFFIPGGRELALPQNATLFKEAMRNAIANRTVLIVMLADTPLIPEKVLQTLSKYKNVLLIESDEISTEDDAWSAACEMQSENYLPTVASAGFDFQVIQMEPVRVKYEDFEIIEKYL